MNKSRVEAFSDGVIAVIITIMVLEIKIPEGHELKILLAVLPKFLNYVLSFVYVGIYWNNHHHLFHAVKKINGKIMWANLHLLFWLSLFPVSTAWMDENHWTLWPVIVYGCILLFTAIAYAILVITIEHTKENALVIEAIGNDKKGKLSIYFYLAAIGLCFVNPWLGIFLYFVVACIWIIPDKRIEKKIE